VDDSCATFWFSGSSIENNDYCPSCESLGLMTCWDGSCVDNVSLCPDNQPINLDSHWGRIAGGYVSINPEIMPPNEINDAKYEIQVWMGDGTHDVGGCICVACANLEDESPCERWEENCECNSLGPSLTFGHWPLTQEELNQCCNACAESTIQGKEY
jgi:hypothetical protein